ncbi:hypothetical protein DHEL01_v203280 [Diaporthe helianthi]|uniref:Pre-mRNA-splicing factor 38B n=1 Tax=Diaporthe helianthi TaxID=158607 RepID=A0A2P5I737_DIAHE|nr:hypothetical protein DHEL01_v203280 [Diaporthe helianthi]
MGNDDLLTDDHVAELLSKEAKDCSLKYSTMGMEAYTSSSPSSSRPSNKAKPNTRFLRNIIKGTEHHNKTLTAKELADSQARLKELAETEEVKRRRYNPTANEIRGRQLGNIAALLQRQPAQKRKRAAANEDETTDLQKARAAEDARRLADTAAARKRARDKDGKRRRSLERYQARRGREDDDDDGKYRYRRANTSSGDEGTISDDRGRRHRSRSPTRSSRKHRHRSPLRRKEKGRGTQRASNQSSKSTEQAESSSRRAREEDEQDVDSDPLEDLIGPAPPPNKPRGRGALRGASGMDSKFSSDYDPKSDVQVGNEDGRDDWDDALEALRDRARYRQQGADRLREAGFNEDQIKKWEKGGEKGIDDVQWTKAGERRDWDRGKNDGREVDE